MHEERMYMDKSNLEYYLDLNPDHRQRYELAIKHAQGLVVADIACGCGYGTYLLSEKAKQVDGYDVSLDALNHANKVFLSKNTQFTNAADITDKKNFYDLIISFETIEHMKESDGDEFLHRLYNALKSDGTLIISTPINNSSQKINVTPFHLREYDVQEFKDKLKKNGFYSKEFIYQGERIMNKPIVGIPLKKMLSLKVHKMLPRMIRNWLLLKMRKSVNNNQPIFIADPTGMSVQIAICHKISVERAV